MVTMFPNIHTKTVYLQKVYIYMCFMSIGCIVLRSRELFLPKKILDKCVLTHPDEKGYYIWNHFELPKYLQPESEGSPVALPRLLEDDVSDFATREWHFNITASSTSIDDSSINTLLFISMASVLLSAASDSKCING
ncbi:uncharacterized protein ACN427_008718 [Glossina fuscipes fuscipes]